ncbi:MAG: PIN domain-containing protein [Candidatus Adiutrix sp.]|jgi:predicted nucleic acid-binding protein|nr:PIN domain-containing protein [Candidatus Adiutrix sp.]
MTKIRTYIDANVIINAWRGLGPFQDNAFAILEDPDRILLSSAFLQLELLPKPTFHKNVGEVAFINRILEHTVHVPTDEQIPRKALELSSRYDLAAIDALHAAAAITGGADELATFESREKPLYKIPPAELFVMSLHPDDFKIH